MTSEPKVSIITPTFNSERFIAETIQSVVKQTHENWEMIIVDDGSQDGTCAIVENHAAADARIRLVKLQQNSGSATARNTPLHKSSGRFVAYLDADDLWYPQKLSKQVHFMLDNQCGFSCVSYEVIDHNGISHNKFIQMKERLDYRGFLVNNLIQTVGVMVDLQRVSRMCLEMPDMRRRQDAATWLQILKNGNACFGLAEVLAKYRRTAGSLSSDTFEAVRGVWHLYRDIEQLPIGFCLYCFSRYAILAVWKRMYAFR
jgi:teichuronic acid biosynthesis glycosyltransferase TuaG